MQTCLLRCVPVWTRSRQTTRLRSSTGACDAFKGADALDGANSAMATAMMTTVMTVPPSSQRPMDPGSQPIID